MERSVGTLRASVCLGVILPLVETIAAERPDIAALGRGVRGAVSLEAGDLAATIRIGDGVSVTPGLMEPNVRVRFGDPGRLADFFAGKLALPRLSPWEALRHPLLLTRAARLLGALRILEPPRVNPPESERALRVRLLLTLVTRALSRLHREGWEPIVELAAHSPERVYQWTVGADQGAWLRMHDGRVQAGNGIYPRRRPFVHFAFPDSDAAFAVLTATGSQMTGFRDGRVRTWGSPEYTRKIALLMQQVDALLMEGA